MKLNDAILGAVFLAVGLLVFWQTRSMPQLSGQSVGAGTFPAVVAAMMVAGGVILIASGLRARSGALVELDPWLKDRAPLIRVLSVPVFVAIYALFSGPIGFPLLVPPLLAAQLWITTRKPVLSIIVALAATAAIWLIFARVLLVPLPLGLLTEVIY
ncbi:tripartite tricarboxylate transporter TctB family protein [Rhodobacteraceae bacterium CCMM004]|nr:tripartite tricarboxylate transporter TctB family protein [Rhodobacteraceae bacterium CCMM004]